MLKGSKTDLSLLEYLVIRLQSARKTRWLSWPTTWTSSLPETPAALWDEHFRTTVRKMVSEDGPDSWKLPLHLPAGLLSCPQQEDAGLAQGGPYWGVRRRSDLPATWVQPFGLYYFGVSELRVSFKPHNKTENLLPKIKEVMESFDRNTMERTCKRFRPRSKAVVAADGSLNE